MKALTICQPYAHLVCLPESNPWHKRVENRDWETRYRGPLLIHAGKSRAWLTDGPRSTYDSCYGIPVSDMTFGGIVARSQLVDCLHHDAIYAGKYADKYPWLLDHPHTNGEWCWILADVQPLVKPIPCNGMQGLWNFCGEIDG